MSFVFVNTVSCFANLCRVLFVLNRLEFFFSLSSKIFLNFYTNNSNEVFLTCFNLKQEMLDVSASRDEVFRIEQKQKVENEVCFNICSALQFGDRVVGLNRWKFVFCDAKLS